MKIFLRVLHAEQEILSRELEDGTYRVGRSEFNEIVLPGENVSRSQMELRLTPSALYMTNMASPGRIKVNGKAVETAEIKPGDTIAIGPFRLLFVDAEQAAPQLSGSLALDPGPLPEPVGEPLAVAESDPPAPPALPQENAAPALALALAPAPSPASGETVVEMKPLVAKLLFRVGPRADEEVRLQAFELSIGRSRKADIFVDDSKLSRFHCKITRVGMGFRLVDCNSRNGTYVNGVRILEHPLSSFDVIEIGRSKIEFLIQDLVAGESSPRSGEAQALIALESTRSLRLVVGSGLPPRPPDPSASAAPKRAEPFFRLSAKDWKIQLAGLRQAFQALPPRKKKILLWTCVGFLVALFLILPAGKKVPPPPAPAASAPAPDVAPFIPKEFGDLTPEIQREVEGQYRAALQAADNKQFDEAQAHLKRVHASLPYYKKSRELSEAFAKAQREKELQEAEQRAKRDEKEDLALYLQEGQSYLKQGDFDRAAESFNAAVVMDPNNTIAIKGLKASELKIRDINKVPPDEDPEKEKQEQVNALLRQAVEALSSKSYQKAIEIAERVRQIELPGDTHYLSEAKQIIDRSRTLQKEEFEPFLIQAKEKFNEGDYNASLDLCQEMANRDPAYQEARECVSKARAQLGRLAKEAYIHGYILESMNRLDDAKKYWERAKNYVRPGDEYYDKVHKKLEAYQ